MTNGEAPALSCDRDRLWALAVGVLEPEETQGQEEHLNRCPSCQAQLGEIRADVEALGCYAGPEQSSPDELSAMILARSRRVQERGRRLRWLALGLVLLGALGLGLVSAHNLTQKALVRQGLWRLEHTIQRVKDAEGSYPPDEAALRAALARQENSGLSFDAEGRPLDYYGQPFRYRYPGTKVKGLFDLWSVGANGIDEEGGPDDQTNWPYNK